MATPYFHGGSGPRVLLLHSGFCTWVEWRRVIEDLAVDHEVLAPTQPGSLQGPPLRYDGSTVLAQHADRIEALLDELGWDQPVPVVGSSFGGVTALELLNRGRAERVLALAPPWVAHPEGTAFYLAAFSPLLGLGLTRPLWSWAGRLGWPGGLMLHQSFRSLAISETDYNDLLESMASFPLVRVFRSPSFRGVGMPDTDRVPQDRVHLVWGTADRLVPRWMRTRWQAVLPGATVTTLPGFPHQPHLRDPVLVSELVREHVADL
ncbi:MAG: hydrolase [Marmoricola sp.]|nr:hydrolase [Marmoricola sp.]